MSLQISTGRHHTIVPDIGNQDKISEKHAAVYLGIFMDVKVTDSYLLGKGVTLQAPLNAGPRPVMTTEGDCTGAVCV